MKKLALSSEIVNSNLIVNLCLTSTKKTRTSQVMASSGLVSTMKVLHFQTINLGEENSVEEVAIEEALWEKEEEAEVVEEPQEVVAINNRREKNTRLTEKLRKERLKRKRLKCKIFNPSTTYFNLGPNLCIFGILQRNQKFSVSLKVS